VTDEGQMQKLEVVRGIASTISFWPRAAGELLDVTSPTVIVYDPSGAVLDAPVAAVQTDKRVTFEWSPSAALACAEDYRYEVEYLIGTDSFVDVVYFDLVRVSLKCPIDDNHLEAEEPDLQKWLQARQLPSAKRWIVSAWDDIVGRIRTAGYRPSLITDRHAFTRAATELSLVKVLTTLIRQPNDVWDRKRELHQEAYVAAWGSVGTIKFEDVAAPGPASKRTISQPRWRR